MGGRIVHYPRDLALFFEAAILRLCVFLGILPHTLQIGLLGF